MAPNIFFTSLVLVCFLHNGSCLRLPKMSDIEDLQAKLTGDLYMPNSTAYEERTTLLNTRFSGRPGFIVLANNTGDIQKCVLFAKSFNLRVTVLSSGHDYIGRAIANNTVHISLKRMRAFSVDTSDPSSDTGVSATIGPGQNWGNIYKLLNEKYGYLAVGGSAPTVAPGGYFVGGGHSPLSPSLGLGVDSILQFEMVTSDGNIINVQKSNIEITPPESPKTVKSDPDLFWATRGGGPGAYGVVTSYKIKLHHPPEAFVAMSCSTYLRFDVPYGEFLGQEFLKVYGDYLRNNRTSKVGGYIILSNAKGIDPTFIRGYNGTVTTIFLYFGGWRDAYQELSPVYHQILGRQLGSCSFTNHSTFWDYQQNSNDPTGYGAYIMNRFLRKDDVNEDLIKLWTETFLKQPSMGCTGTLLGGKVGEAAGDSASVSPEFRQGQISMTCYVTWPEAGDNKPLVEEMRKKWGPAFYKFGKGVYLNEPDYYLNNWKQEYWGINYDRLLKIKRKWDPNGMFWCRHCVGSDLFSENPSPPWPIPSTARGDHLSTVSVGGDLLPTFSAGTRASHSWAIFMSVFLIQIYFRL